jgi:hypothetical protein
MSLNAAFEFLAFSISCIQPVIIRHMLATNQNSCVEAALHFELYTAMRGVLK